MEKNNNILVQTLIRGKDSAKRLQNLLSGETNNDHVSVSVDELLTEVSESFASGLSMLSTSRSEVHQGSEVLKGNNEKTSTLGQSFSADSNLSRNNEKTPLVLVKQGRGQYKRKTGDTKIEVSNASEDCFQWRKYGQKAILNSKFPRFSYAKFRDSSHALTNDDDFYDTIWSLMASGGPNGIFLHISSGGTNHLLTTSVVDAASHTLRKIAFMTTLFQDSVGL
ncbi:probable WRKY transcription factor 70 [Tanacetum coccineum]